MAKIERFDGNLQAFGINATGTERTVYGAGTQSDTLDDNMNTAYLRGWGSLAAGVKPPREHFNGAMYTNSLLSAYLHQSGVAEWNTSQEYYSGGICRNGFGLYQSNIDSNIGNDPTTDDGSSWIQLSSALSAGRNVIVNGSFDIFQLGNSLTGLGGGTHHVMDMWRLGVSGASVTSVRDVDKWNLLSSLPNAGMRSTITTAQSSIPADQVVAFGHRSEGHRIRPLRGQTVTLSFWVYATVTGTYCVAFSNDGSDRSYVVEYTVNSSNTAEYKTITLNMDETGGTWDVYTGTGLRVRFTQACGSNYQTSTTDTWITGNYYATSNQVNNDATIGNVFVLQNVQLELGGTATPFEYKPYGEMLCECMRCLQLIPAGTNSVFSNGYVNNAATFTGTIITIVPLRTTPTMSGPTVYQTIGAGTFKTITPSVASTDSYGVGVTATIPDSSQNLNTVAAVSSGANYIELDARLT